MQMMDLPRVEIHFVTRLDLIASVDKQQGAIAQDQRQPGKASEPRQFVIVRGAIFALMRIRPGNDYTVQRLRDEKVAERRKRTIHKKVLIAVNGTEVH